MLGHGMSSKTPLLLMVPPPIAMSAHGRLRQSQTDPKPSFRRLGSRIAVQPNAKVDTQIMLTGLHRRSSSEQ